MRDTLHCPCESQEANLVSVIDLFNLNYDTTTGKAKEPFQSIFQNSDKSVVFGCENCFAYAGVSFKFRCYCAQCLHLFVRRGGGVGGWGVLCNINLGHPCTSAQQGCISSMSNWNSKANSSRISILLPLHQPPHQALK